ncbi:hypothetical protein D3C75_767630 [compost metagenome]
MSMLTWSSAHVLLEDMVYGIEYTGEWVVAVVSLNEIGIDIEKKSSFDFDLAKRFYTPAENEIIAQQHMYI